MCNFRQIVRVNVEIISQKRTDGRTNGGQCIGPTSKVGGSNKGVCRNTSLLSHVDSDSLMLRWFPTEPTSVCELSKLPMYTVP